MYEFYKKNNIKTCEAQINYSAIFHCNLMWQIDYLLQLYECTVKYYVYKTNDL